ncbi:cellulose biosynthesis protein BcsG [Steroidobacter flavus]|uniref:Cellulose biosynthesis protein BcsG n=1 Tax=Steroidobacter flavus TaxID=1842136 RepID=A0ABV8SLZ4_9GAMM
MGLWSAYFFAKFGLFALGYIGFNPWWNLAFAIFTALPPQNPRQRFTKNLIAIPLGILLLYHDSWLPPFARVLEQTNFLKDFTPDYLWELAQRFINWRLLLGLVVFGFVYALARRKLRLSTFVFIAILIILVQPEAHFPLEPAMANVPQAARPAQAAAVIDPRNMRADALNTMLAEFYAKEQQRQVRFSPLAGDDAPYDIILLHVCSLSWDDLDFVRDNEDPLLHRFNIVFDQFSSGASYSGPAAIRLLRANCGQVEQRELYEPPKKECLLIDGLQRVGFEPQWLMNHDGHFGDFFSDVRVHGGFPAEPLPHTNAPVTQHAFDGSPIYDDYAVLSRWWNQRLSDETTRVALYYNSISLHDGNRVDGAGRTGSTYEARMTRFSSDIRRFLDDLQASGRRVVVMFIPEHGAAVRGDRRQIPGLREVPTRAITRVPVGVLLVNANSDAADVQQRVSSPTSYLAVSELLSRFIADNPFAKQDLHVSSYTQNLPQTDAVAQNEGTTLLQIRDTSMVRMPSGEWTAWDAGRE